MTTKTPDKPFPTAAVLLLAGLTVLSLAPFAAKPFNIDEPLFVWVAKQIQAHPLDFYGFRVNWYGTEMSVAGITKNPPLASYYLALLATLFGWSEVPLHLGFLLPALAATSGTYLLARRLTRHPLHATILAVATPAFLVSSATVMCDTMMLAFYVWTILFWMRGLDRESSLDLLVASLLLALATLTKYFGITLFPLLVAYTWFRGSDRLHRALFLLVPVVILAAYQYGTFRLYGRGLLSDAMGYSGRQRHLNALTLVPDLISGLVFTGGCLLAPLFLVGEFWRKRTLALTLALLPAGAWLLSRLPFMCVGDDVTWSYYFQMAAMGALGIGILDIVRRAARDTTPGSRLLILWAAGTFIFAALVNWTVNGRTILPMAPAVGILGMRLLEREKGESWRPGKGMLAGLAAAWIAAMAVTYADARLADTARDAAAAIVREFGGTGKKLWFQGHWGFQYYMEQGGATPFDARKSIARAGDLMALSDNNTNLIQEVVDRGFRIKILSFPPATFMTTMSFPTGAGYYSHRYGALPFFLNPAPEENYHIITFKEDVPGPDIPKPEQSFPAGR